MKKLISLLLLLLPFTESAFADEYLVCSGVTTLFYGTPLTEERLSSSVSMRFTGKYVEMSDVGLVGVNKRAGITWVWTKTIGDEYWLYNYDTVSGRLVKNVLEDKTASHGSRRAVRQDTYQCRPAERLID